MGNDREVERRRAEDRDRPVPQLRVHEEQHWRSFSFAYAYLDGAGTPTQAGSGEITEIDININRWILSKKDHPAVHSNNNPVGKKWEIEFEQQMNEFEVKNRRKPTKADIVAIVGGSSESLGASITTAIAIYVSRFSRTKTWSAQGYSAQAMTRKQVTDGSLGTIRCMTITSPVGRRSP